MHDHIVSNLIHIYDCSSVYMASLLLHLFQERMQNQYYKLRDSLGDVHNLVMKHRNIAKPETTGYHSVSL